MELNDLDERCSGEDEFEIPKSKWYISLKEEF